MHLLSGSGGCSVCGYLYDNPQHPDPEMIKSPFSEILKNKLSHDEEYSVKIFTSGSFLDINEVSPDTQKSILQEFQKKRIKNRLKGSQL